MGVISISANPLGQNGVMIHSQCEGVQLVSAGTCAPLGHDEINVARG